MERLNFIGGGYSARSSVASSQRCVNYYPEINPPDSQFPITLYQRPGLRQLSNTAGANSGGWRCLYQGSNGIGYGVNGQNVYRINSDFSTTLLGQVGFGRTNICSMIDNGQDVVVVDGSINGWEFDVATGANYAPISDPTGIFNGANRVDMLDTFLLWNLPNTLLFGASLSNEIQFDALNFAGKAAYPDLLQTLIVNRRELLLLGSLKSEIWYNAGNTNFPFAELPGAYIEHGIVARYTIAAEDISVFWLSKDLQGNGVVLRQRGYETKRISNHAVEYAIRQINNSVGISDAIAYCYQQDGHVFYVLTFPAGNQTWVFDDAMQDPVRAWHQRAWSDKNGNLNRERVQVCASLYGKIVGGDWENGSLYQLDQDYYLDQVDAGDGRGLVEGPITCIRGFPHLMAGLDKIGRIVPANGRTITHASFWAAMECGGNPSATQPGQISLRWSDDWGKTHGNAVLQSAGKLGEYSSSPQFATLGLSRYRQYELFHSIPGPAALNGAWVMGRVEEANRGAGM